MTPEHLRLVISNLRLVERMSTAERESGDGKPSAAAIAANPPMSNRAIADDIGVSHQTVKRAREEGVTNVTPERATTGRFTAQVRNPPHLSVKAPAPPVDHLWEIYRAKKQISDRTLNRDDIERSRIAYNRWNARFNSDDPAVNEIPPGKAWGLY